MSAKSSCGPLPSSPWYKCRFHAQVIKPVDVRRAGVGDASRAHIQTIASSIRGHRALRRAHRRLSVAFSFAHRHGRSVVPFSRMSKLIYITHASLDGYIEDQTVAFDWSNPDQVFDFITELMRPIGTHLLGRRLYETMAYWDAPVEGYPARTP